MSQSRLMADPRHRFTPPNPPPATLTRSTGSPVALCNRGSGIRLACGFTQELRMGRFGRIDARRDNISRGSREDV
jgi:hypothetical protein